jgi:transcriptional regulator with XRE-family HTH domain
MADPAIVREICKGLKQMRLDKNLSQQELANRAGLSRITISHMESGRSANLLTIVQILRVFDKLNVFNEFVQEPEISPLILFEQQEKMRKKATPKQYKK